VEDVVRVLVLLEGVHELEDLVALSSGSSTMVFGTYALSEWLGKCACIYRFDRELLPMFFHEGVVQAGMAAVGAKSVEVTSTQETLTRGQLNIRWAD
jgi:uncharacterized protein (TIGR02265 family)